MWSQLASNTTPPSFQRTLYNLQRMFVAFWMCVWSIDVCLHGCVSPTTPLTHHLDSHPPTSVVVLGRAADWLPVHTANMPSRPWPPASPVAPTDWSFPRNIRGRLAGNQGGGCEGAEERGVILQGVPLEKSFLFFLRFLHQSGMCGNLEKSRDSDHFNRDCSFKSRN